MDISDDFDANTFRGTIAHEFLHIMENRINDHGLETGLDYLSYWMSFVPEPELYYYNYRDYQDANNHPEDHVPISEFENAIRTYVPVAVG